VAGALPCIKGKKENTVLPQWQKHLSRLQNIPSRLKRASCRKTEQDTHRAHNYRLKKHTAVVQCPLAQLNGALNYAWFIGHAKTSYQKETSVPHVLITMSRYHHHNLIYYNNIFT
jgi:hypothetical protein